MSLSPHKWHLTDDFCQNHFKTQMHNHVVRVDVVNKLLIWLKKIIIFKIESRIKKDENKSKEECKSKELNQKKN